jgi:hypothetical protein
MKNYLLLLLLAFFTFQCTPDTKEDENFTEEDTGEFVSEENSNKLSDLEEKMEELEAGKASTNSIKEVVKQKAEGAKSVQVDINIATCKLKLSGGSKQLFTGGFAYSQADWKPETSYKLEGKKGFLEIKQPDTKNININDDDEYVWNLKFGEKTPLNINLEFGAGVSEIQLGGLPIKNFNMLMGVGKTTLDLRGEWKQNAEIHLDGGIGLLQVYLPESIGVQIKTIKGLGSIEVLNMIKKDKNTYVNKQFNKSKININIFLKTGIGKIEIE